MHEKPQIADFKVMSVGNLKVKIFDAKGTNVIPVAKSTVTVGSAAHCDVVVDHASVQPEHVRAWIDGGRIWIQDLGTAGGTFLNGIRLPALKPMLVRDLDVLKLGESPATLGMEANMVRAPLVRAAATTEETTQTDIRPIAPKDQDLEKRRDELAKVSRDLAELKLQLQMARLEKSTADELRKQVNSLREELRLLAEEKEATREAVRKMNDDSEARRQASEEAAARAMELAELEIREMRDAAGRKLGHWKVDMVAELSQQLHTLSLQKAQEWVTRPLSKDMMFEWEAELNQMFHRTLLSEGTHALPPTETTTRTTPDFFVKDTDLIDANESEDLGETTRVVPSSAKRRQQPRFKLKASHLAWIGGGVLVLLTLALRPWHRFDGSRSLASQAAMAASNQAAPPPPTLPQRFNPKLSKNFKKSYTDNVLYTESYAEAELNSDFRQRWMSDLIKVGRAEWHVDDRTLSAIVSRESALIQDLQRLKERIQVARQQDGIAAMRTREAAFQRDLQSLLRDPALVDRFHRLKLTFYTRNQQYLVKQVR